jgi:hypothetical protein
VADPEWGEMIRTELDSYVPERLPARFTPRVRRRRRVPAVGWRPVAVGVGVLMLGFAFATVAGGPESFYRSVTQINQSRNLTPVPTGTPTPTPEKTAKVGRSPIVSNRARSGSPSRPAAPTAAPPAAAAPAPVAQVSSQAQTLTTSPPPPAPRRAHRSAPAPTPTPSKQVCLLGIICLNTTD